MSYRYCQSQSQSHLFSLGPRRALMKVEFTGATTDSEISLQLRRTGKKLSKLSIKPVFSNVRSLTVVTLSSINDELLQLYEACMTRYLDFDYEPDVMYCNKTFDGFLCWAPTPVGEKPTQLCPPARLSDTTRYAYRRCGDDGLWLGRKPDERSALGWTNFTPCFPPDVQTLFTKVYDDEHAQDKFEIAQKTRYLEIAGFSISLIALILSLFIFSYYRSLRNNRTRIHKSLFSAMMVQVIIRLIVYIDQALVRSVLGDNSYDTTTMQGIDNMPYLCESAYVLLEYAITVMFMWMFIEGLYLHSVVTANALRERVSHVPYYATGWGIPLVITGIWAGMTAYHYKKESVMRCWYGYNFSPFYWIVQGPRLAVILVNLVFLLNIMRVLIVKLRQSQSTELAKVRKAVRAALVLLPLLGITNSINMIEAPLDGSVWEFGLWSYSTHFLRSFQGFFIALIYCFLNGEVRQVLNKHYTNISMKWDLRRRNDSLGGRSTRNKHSSDEARAEPELRKKRNKGMRNSTTTKNDNETEFEPENTQEQSSDEARSAPWFRMNKIKWMRSSTTSKNVTNVTEIDAESTQEHSSDEAKSDPWILMKKIKWTRSPTTSRDALGNESKIEPASTQETKSNGSEIKIEVPVIAVTGNDNAQTIEGTATTKSDASETKIKVLLAVTGNDNAQTIEGTVTTKSNGHETTIEVPVTVTGNDNAQTIEGTATE